MKQLDSNFDAAFEAVEKQVSSGNIPGAVLGRVTRDGQFWCRAVGYAQTEPLKRPMHEAIWFDLASLSKVIFTTPRILALAEAGVIDLDAPLASVLGEPEVHNPAAWLHDVTFRQCLGHQTLFPAEADLYKKDKSPALLRAHMVENDWPAGPPVYSDVNFILLGMVVEQIAGKWIRDMDPGAGFAFSADPAHSAATEFCPWRGRLICGKVHDENCAALQGGGHAGLFGTAGSVLGFAQGLLDGSGASQNSISLMRTPLSAHTTHGWQRFHEGWPGGNKCSPQTIGHTGFTGTGLWIDFARGHAWTLLTNHIHPSRHKNTGLAALRQKVGNIISTGPDVF